MKTKPHKASTCTKPEQTKHTNGGGKWSEQNRGEGFEISASTSNNH